MTQINFQTIKNAEQFEIEVSAKILSKYGSWDFEGGYQDFKQGTLFDDGIAAWADYETWLSNTHIRIMVSNGETTYEQRWYDGHNWINALGSDSTGDDTETINNILSIIASGESYEIITFDYETQH
jgi:predicted AlkP superfamily phosphohydrolase/phosphomutase